MKHIPFFKFVAILQILLLARRHLNGLSRDERRRMVTLLGRSHRLSRAERHELRDLAGKLEPVTFARGAVGHVSPLRMKK